MLSVWMASSRTDQDYINFF